MLGRWFKAQSLPLCCFLRQESCLVIAKKANINDHQHDSNDMICNQENVKNLLKYLAFALRFPILTNYGTQVNIWDFTG